MWLLHALAAMLIISCITLAFRWMMNQRQHPVVVIFVFKLSAAICLLPKLLALDSLPDIGTKGWILIVLCGFLSNLGDLGQLKAIEQAANPGYAQGIIFVFPVFVLVASTMMADMAPGFTANCSPLQWTGALLCVLGAILLCLPERAG